MKNPTLRELYKESIHILEHIRKGEHHIEVKTKYAQLEQRNLQAGSRAPAM